MRTWHGQTSEMVDVLIHIGPPPFGGITDIHDHLTRAVPGGGATGEDFAAIAATLLGCAVVRQWVLGLGEDRPLLRAIGERLDSFDGEVRAIEKVIDTRGLVKDTASERLARIRAESETCQQQIRQIVYEFVRRRDVTTLLQSTTVQLHEDRYVLPVKADQRGRLGGVVHRASHSGATLFVEPNECVHLNNHLVRLGEKEHDEISRLLGQLAIRVHARGGQIRRSLGALAQLDLIGAKAQYAYQFEMTCPTITERGPLRFHQARHPLLIEQDYQQELAAVPADQRHPVVPIDVRLGGDFDLLIVTGSNTGGKTVALKTVGLLVLMAQSGLHVPAQRGSTLPVFRDVLLDVGDEQSLQQSLSTFGGHLKRIKHILRRADRYSLVLLDELGSGTDPEEGGAIGQAVLDELRALGCLGMVSTHLGVLKAYAYTHDRVDNASVEFDTETLSPTFRLLIGQPGESHAIVVAQHYGLSHRLIRSAKRHLPEQGQRLREAIRATTASRRDSEAALTAAQTARVQAESQQEQYTSKLNELETLAQQFTDWIGSLPAMKSGDEVYVRRFGKAGTLERLQLSRQVAVVNVDNVQVEVPLQELMPDLGDTHVREEITSLRKQIALQTRRAEADRDEAKRTKVEYQRSLSSLRSRQRTFDRWLAAIGKLTVGQEVTFADPPGRGRLVAMDLEAGKVTVEVDGGAQEVRVQGLFPESDVFAGKTGRRAKAKRSSHKGAPQQADKPVPHRRADTRIARANRGILLQLPPKSEVYVVPLRKRASLVRIDREKDLATVQSGPFEVEVALADLEPLRGP